MLKKQTREYESLCKNQDLGKGLRWLPVLASFNPSPAPHTLAPSRKNFQLFDYPILLHMFTPSNMLSLQLGALTNLHDPQSFMTPTYPFELPLDVPSRIFPWSLNPDYISSQKTHCSCLSQSSSYQVVTAIWYFPLKCVVRNSHPSCSVVNHWDLEHSLAYIRISINMY